MITGFLSLLCLGLCLGFEGEHKNEKLPKPSLNALPGPVVKHSANVTLKCHCHFQNVTVMLGKLQDPGYKQEQSSAGYDAQFLLVDLEPKTAGIYFCAYKTMGSHEWSEKSEPLQLVVTDTRDGSGASSVKTDTRVIFVTTFSCLIIFLLFPSIFLIYRCTQHGSSHKEATKSHSKFPKQEASDLPKLETESLSTEDPQEDTPADVNNEAPAEEEPLGSCE
ncbi:V-set and transmembrane domain-containing protein 1-like isoform X2 [Phyllostomus hastatus]|uniref:V-set and transmembrane domain-containing protein 1-like isoform X2 n=1 Tax=Phyllostomus hastatus TaxID=9423 RepID=UPI001E67F697|nr:V-set and transmembrane domain-containing protein 1-like isoform X2 [Phyllostomus hastatus]